MLSDTRREAAEQGILDGCKPPLQLRQGRQRVTQAGEIAWTGRFQCDAREDALHVAQSPKGIMQAVEVAVVEQGVHTLMAALQQPAVAQGPLNPAAQQAAAHGACRMVKDTREGVFGPSGGRMFEFEVAATRRIHDDRFVGSLHAQTTQVR